MIVVRFETEPCKACEHVTIEFPCAVCSGTKQIQQIIAERINESDKDKVRSDLSCVYW